MQNPSAPRPETANNGLRPWLLATKLLGLVAVLGGLAALSAMRFFGPVPETLDQWGVLIAVMRAVFFPCVLAGLPVVILSGLALLAPRWRSFARRRWFQIKVLVLLMGLPSLHVWGRGHVLSLYSAIDEGRLADAAVHWKQAGNAFFVALCFLLSVAAFARFRRD